MNREAAATHNFGEQARLGEPRSLYEVLNVRPFINCCGPRTVHGGSLMPRGVIDAMNEAAGSFVHVPELMRRAGERIAKLLGAEASLVTAGGASALTLGTAAALTHGDPELMLRLPAVDGRCSTVIAPAGGRFAYDQAIRAAGATIVEVASLEELRVRIDEGAVMILV